MPVISRLNHAASVLAAYASSSALLHSHARLASGWWLAFAGRESNSLDSIERFQSIAANVLLSQVLPGATVGNAQRFPRQAPRFAAGELSTNPQPLRWLCSRLVANHWCLWLFSTIKEPGWRGTSRHLPSAEGQTTGELPHPHRQASMRNLAASDRRFERKLTPVCVPPQQCQA